MNTMLSRKTNKASSSFETVDGVATIHLVQSSLFARGLAKFLIFGLILSILAMAFLPWQQTSRGSGQIVAFAPQERQQNIQSPTKGIVGKIKEGLIEGSKVKQGELLLEIQPLAANQVEQLEASLRELETQAETAAIQATAYAKNIEGFQEARDYAVSAAEEMVSAAEKKLESKESQRAAYKAKELQARLNFERQEGLFNKGLKPAREIEKLRKEWDIAIAELVALPLDIQGLKNEVTAKEKEVEEKRSVAQTKIDYARAMEQDALGKVAKARKEIADATIKLAETNRLKIYAPRDGTVFRLMVNERGVAVKEGDSLLTIVPESTNKAVEMYVSGNDMPLVQRGQSVRLQFEGWPAVQFAGWPSVAVGTFSGTVSTVDATDNGKGEFRILVIPEDGEQEWPSDRYLRQGVRVNGWVILKKVALGQEIWRQLNGFPVSISDSEPKGKAKPPKLPK